MHADEAIRAIGRRGEFRDRDRGRVGGEQRLRPQFCAEVLQDLDLQIFVFGRSFNDEIASGQFGVVRGHGNARQRRLPVGVGHLLLVDQAFQATRHDRHAPRQRGVGDVGHDHGETGGGAHLGDAVTHGARAYDTDLFDHDG